MIKALAACFILVLAACAPQARPGVFSTAIPQPATSTLNPTATATAPPPTPSPTATETPTPPPTASPTETAVPTASATPVVLLTNQQGCSSFFAPVGFGTNENSLLGLLTVEGQPATALEAVDLQSLASKTVLSIQQGVTASALSPDRQTLALALQDFTIQIVDLQKSRVTSRLTGHTGQVNALVFSPDGQKLYSGALDRTVRVWDLKRKSSQSFNPAGADDLASPVYGLGVSPDGGTLITIPEEGNAKAYETGGFRQVGEYKGTIFGGYAGASARYSPDGQYLVISLSGGYDSATMFRLKDNSPLWKGAFLADFDFSADNRLFAHTRMTEEGKVEIIVRSEDAQTVIRTIPTGLETVIFKLFFTPGGEQIISSSGWGVHIWNVSDGALARYFAPGCP